MHKHIASSRLGHWLPADKSVLNNWLQQTIEAANETKKVFHPVISEFQQLIETNPVLYMYFTQMFQQQPHIRIQRGSGDVKIKDYHQMLRIINHVLTTAPEFNNTEMVGFPINAILDYPMYTTAGQAAFLDTTVNAMLKKILAVWTSFLNSADSCYVLNENENGWLGAEAQKAIKLDEFILDKAKPFYGFTSWNDFFIRQFKPGMRPLPPNADDEKIIVSACESQPFAINTHIKKTDAFWLKGQSYSLEHLLNGKHVDYYNGGTVYQAFLSAEKYHRWHSPVDGVIKEIVFVDGTYYAEAYSAGFDPVGPNNSQGYIAHVAARALIFIETNNKKLGMVCVIPIGMAEVSSCIVTVKENQQVKKGEQLGYFQFGGSTHCLVFKKGAIAQFAGNAIPQGEFGSHSNVVKVNELLAITD